MDVKGRVVLKAELDGHWDQHPPHLIIQNRLSSRIPVRILPVWIYCPSSAHADRAMLGNIDINTQKNKCKPTKPRDDSGISLGCKDSNRLILHLFSFIVPEYGLQAKPSILYRTIVFFAAARDEHFKYYQY